MSFFGSLTRVLQLVKKFSAAYQMHRKRYTEYAILNIQGLCLEREEEFMFKILLGIVCIAGFFAGMLGEAMKKL